MVCFGAGKHRSRGEREGGVELGSTGAEEREKVEWSWSVSRRTFQFKHHVILYRFTRNPGSIVLKAVMTDIAFELEIFIRSASSTCSGRQ